ncbi:MAG: hypothetical protein IJP92_16365, partial [Lachnospiraceae bacterium]|nr:hypothetical protein [Lachnospiraceae bacterium]
MTAKQLNRVRTTALVLLIFLFLLICVYVLSGAWQRGARYPLYRLSSPHEIGMNYEEQTGENSTPSLSRYANFKGDFREQRYLLPEDDIPAPALRVYTADAILDVFLDGKELLSYGTPQLEAYSFVPGGYHLVTLPEDSAGSELTIRYTATAGHTELFPGTPLYGNLQDIVSFWVSETRIVVYAGIFLCLFGFLLTSLWFLMRQSSGEDPQMFFAGLIAFLTGLYTLCRHDALFFFTNSCTLRTYIESFTQLLFPVLIALFLRLLAHDLIEQRLFFFCAMIAAALAVIVVMLQFLRIVPLTTGMRAARIGFIGVNLVLFVAGVRILRRWFLQFRRLRASALQDAPTAGHTGNLLLLSGILFLTLAMLADVLFEFFDITPGEDRI